MNTLKVKELEFEGGDSKDSWKVYSYTSDYLSYENCSRQYMAFRKYGFAASRSQTLVFGSLVHQTIEDIHRLIIQNRKAGV